MKVVLNNFGVWSKKTFEFPDSGLTLITAPSGKGKTTIFRAIIYALTGEGTKLPTLGETKCSVTLEYQDLKVTRTNRPSRLKLVTPEGEYENEEAQSLIYQRVGKHFRVAGYIQQKAENSFLGMAPAEKLRFLEQVAFSEVPMEEVKEKVKAKVSEAEHSLHSVQGELKYLEEHPLAQPEERVETEEELIRARDRVLARVKEGEKELVKVQERIKQQLLAQQAQKNLSKQLSELQEVSVPEVTGDLKEYEREIKVITEWETYESARKHLEESQKKLLLPHEEELARLKAQVDQIVEVKFEEHAELKELEAALIEYTRQQEIFRKRATFHPERYRELSLQVPVLEEKYRNYLLGKEARKCPQCQASVRVHGDTLHLYSGSVYSLETERKMRKELDELKKELSGEEFAKRVVENLPAIEEEIELDLAEVKARIEELKALKVEIEKQSLSHQALRDKYQRKSSDDTVRRLKRQLEEFALKTVPSHPDRSRKEVEKLVVEYKTAVKERERAITTNLQVKEKREKLSRELSLLVQIEDLTFLTTREAELRQDIFDARRLSKEHDEILMDFYLNRLERTRYQKYIDDLTSVQARVKRAQTRYTLLRQFREHVLQSEMLALQSLIDEINTHLAPYLQVFFPDNPLTLEVKLFKANEKTKIVRNQVNLSVGYRGAVTDLSTLSGGERDRVNLAFTLALAEIFSIPLLMLDETLSSLDREMTENILEHIQKDSRAILVIAHQVSLGLFDHVYTV